MNLWKEISANDLTINPFNQIGKDWMLVTAGDEEKINTMTASWGSLGIMWGKPVAFTFIRPQRYTKEFIDSHDTFSLCFFDESYRKTLSYLGTVSGRDEDKVKNANLTPCFMEGTPCFEEANLVVIAQKLYVQDMLPDCFIDSSLDDQWYSEKDYHTMYVSEIKKIFIRS